MKLRALRAAPFALGYWLGVAGAMTRSDGCARILMLHGTPRREAAALERILRYVKRHFDVVPLASIARDTAARGVRFRRQVALTFDDGLRNNVEVSYPLLRSLSLPATFFVCPGLVDEARWMWNHEARQRLLRLPPPQLQALAGEFGLPAHVEACIDWMKSLPLEARLAAERRIREATPRFAATAAEHDDFDVAGWEALRRMDPAIVTIGSHTLTHPILPSLTPEALEREVADSRARLEEALHRRVDQFAYPNGSYNAGVHACVQRHYALAASVEEGYVWPGADLHSLPRLSAPWSGLRLALRLHDYFRVTPITTSGSHVAI